MEYYSVNKIMTCSNVDWLKRFIVLSAVSQRKTNTIWYWFYVEYKKWEKWTYLWNRKRVPDVESKLMVTRGERGKRSTGRLRLTYIHYYIQNRWLIRTCSIAQGSLFNTLKSPIQEKNLKNRCMYTVHLKLIHYRSTILKYEFLQNKVRKNPTWKP